MVHTNKKIILHSPTGSIHANHMLIWMREHGENPWIRRLRFFLYLFLAILTGGRRGSMQDPLGLRWSSTTSGRPARWTTIWTKKVS